jgi:DNA-binding MarR family transcriptional regulator/GNAT superfamily N-acetyltransferase
MGQAMVAQVRRFNRVVTQRAGALDDRFVGLRRPLAEARLMWEIGAEGCDVRLLRSRLDLDSGYLSRLLRRLEADGVVRVRPSAHDRRVRTATLTAAGRREVNELDRRSERLAESVLDGLDAAQRERLVRAMGEVERLLTTALVRIEVVDPDDPHARHCLREYAAELDGRFPDGFDPSLSTSVSAPELRLPAGLMLVARLRGEPVGCGALKLHPGGPSLIKRMWVAESARGLGLGRRLLAELEARAAEFHPVVQLDTNRTLTEAIAMYRSAGYAEVERFNEERYAHHWFEKDLRAGLPSAREGP